MKNPLFKKSFALVLAVLMLFTAVPAGVFAADKDLPVIKAFTSVAGDFHAYKTEIVTVTFLDYIDEAEYAACSPYAWDISASSETGTVKAWMKVNAEETAAAGATRYDVYIGGSGGVAANAYSADLFWNFKKLKRIDGLEKFDTSNATNFSYMFNMCESIESLDLSSWDTSNVTTFLWMFNTCYKLKELNLSGWDTSSATNMNSMFKNCKSITELDISSFDTSKVTNMNSMFYNCIVLADLYVGEGWNIENVTDGAQAFNCCDALPGFDPQNSQGSIDYADKYVKPVEQKPQAKKYTVTYEFIGDVIPEGVTAPEAATYDEGISVTVADNSSTEHYVFSGWKTEDAEVVNGEFVINNDVHFVGSWTKLYKVEYKYHKDYKVPEGAPELPATVYYKAGDTVDVSWPPYVERYIFIGWNTEDADVAGYMFDMPEKDVVLYGYFKIPVESIEILDTEDLVINQGDKTTLNVYVKPEDATIKTVVYESSNPDVVIIDEYNRIVAVGEGEATVTVKSEDDPTKSDTITVTVKKPVTSIGVTPAEVVLDSNDDNKKTTILTVIVNEDATNKEVTYESADEKVAIVDENGKITAIGDGETIITVTSNDDPSKKVTIPVTVKTPVKEITVTEKITVEVEKVEKITASVNEDATVKEICYETNDGTIAKVDEEGNVIGANEGTTTIRVWPKDNPDLVKEVTVTVYKKYNVTYEYEGDIPEDAPALPAEEAYKTDTEVDVEAVPSVEGYTFTGWTTDDAAVEDGKFTMPSKDVVLKGKWTKINYYDVTYKFEGEVPANVELSEGATYEEGTRVEVAKAPTAEGYIFEGWTSEDADITSGEFNIYNDVVITGEWSKLYNVTYEYEGVVPENAPALPVEESYKAGAEVAVEAVPSVEGYTFSGWNTDDATVDGGKFTMPSKDVVLKGSFEKIKVPVDGITVDKTGINLKEGEKETITVTVTPDNATNPEVTYKSNDEDIVKVDENGNITAVGEGTTTITVTSKDDESKTATVTVKVVAVKYNVTYEYVGDVPAGAPAVPDKAAYKAGKTVDVEAVPSVDGYSFTGWYTEDVTLKDGKFTMPEKDVVLYGFFMKKITSIPVESIVIDSQSTTVLEYDGSNTAEGYIKVFVDPINATDKSVTYTSSDEAVVTVDEKGKITAQGIGTATITVTSKSDPTKSDSITVTVKKPYVPVDEVVVEGLGEDNKIKVNVNETVKINAHVVPGNATNQNLIYTSKNPDIATIDENGNITAIKEGTTVIKVTSEDDYSDYKEFLVVVTVPVTDINLAEKEIELEEGNSYTVTATVNPDNASDKSVTYTSSDESVVTVDKNGKITAVKAGTATVTVASASDPEVKKTVTVKVNPPKNPGYTIVTPESVSINEGETKNLGVTITPNDGTIKPVYKSADESIVTVDADGNITGIKAGLTTITVDFGNGDVRIIPVVVDEVVIIPVKHYICFGKTDGIGWYEVSVNGGDFFPQGPNSTLEVEEGSVLVVRVQDMWIDDEFDFYVNGSKVPMDAANTITVVVDGYMLIGALSMDVEVPDVDESISFLDRISNFFANIINWFKNLFKW